MDIDTKFDKDICCENCKDGRRGKSNGVLENGFIEYLIDQTESLRYWIKAKCKIVDHLFTLELSLYDEKNVSYKNVQVNKSSNKDDSETVCGNYSPQGLCFIEHSNDLNEDFINILNELHNSSTLKDDFKQALRNHAMKLLFTTTVHQLLILTLIPNLTC